MFKLNQKEPNIKSNKGEIKEVSSHSSKKEKKIRRKINLDIN